jgi:hypothetical protein
MRSAIATMINSQAVPTAMSQGEAFHILFGLPMHLTSRKFTSINTEVGVRSIDLEKLEEEVAKAEDGQNATLAYTIKRPPDEYYSGREKFAKKVREAPARPHPWQSKQFDLAERDRWLKNCSWWEWMAVVTSGKKPGKGDGFFLDFFETPRIVEVKPFIHFRQGESERQLEGYYNRTRYTLLAYCPWPNKIWQTAQELRANYNDTEIEALFLAYMGRPVDDELMRKLPNAFRDAENQASAQNLNIRDVLGWNKPPKFLVNDWQADMLRDEHAREKSAKEAEKARQKQKRAEQRQSNARKFDIWGDDEPNDAYR